MRGQRTRRTTRATAGESWRRSPLRTWLMALVLLKIAGLVLIVDPLADQAFALPKSLFAYAATALLAGTLCAAAAWHGLAPVPRTRVWAAVGAYVLVTAAATATAEVPGLALFGDAGRYLGLVHIVDLAVFSLAVAVSFRSRKDWLLVFVVITAVSALAMAYALVQRNGLDPIRWQDDPRNASFSTFGNSGYFGTYLVSLCAACISIALFSPRRLWLAGWSVVLAAPAGALLLLLATRSALLGGAAVVGVLAACIARQGLSRGRATAAGAAAAVGIGLLALAISLSPLGRRTVDTLSNADIAGRAAIYRVALQATLLRPVFGWGPDSVAVFDLRLRSGDEERAAPGTRNNSAHSWILQASSTTGLVGLAALFGVIATTGGLLWRALDRDRLVAVALLGAYAAYWASSLTTVTDVTSDWIPWLVTGGAIALTGRRTEDAAGLSRALRGPVAAAALVLGVLAMPFAWPALDASQRLHSVKGLLREPANIPGALALARSAVALDGGRSDYWDAYGYTLHRAEAYREAIVAYEAAAALAPHEPELWLSLGRTHVRLAQSGQAGDHAGRALRAGARATEVAPFFAAAHGGRAEIAFAVRAYDLALAEAVTAWQLAPRDASLDAQAAAAAGQASNPFDARARLTELVSTRDSATLRIAIARLSLVLREPAVARQNAARALELEPGNLDAMTVLRQAG